MIEGWVYSCKIMALLNKGKLMESWFFMKQVCLTSTDKIPFQVGVNFMTYFSSNGISFLIPVFAEEFEQLTCFSEDIKKIGYYKYLESLLKAGVAWSDHWRSVVNHLLYVINDRTLRNEYIQRIRLEANKRKIELPHLAVPKLNKSALLLDSTFEDAVENMLLHLNTTNKPSEQEFKIRLKLQGFLGQNNVQKAWDFLEDEVVKGTTFMELHKIMRIMKRLSNNGEFYFVIALTNYISEKYKLDVSTHSYSLVLKQLGTCHVNENWRLLVQLMYHETSYNSIIWTPNVIRQLQKLVSRDSNKFMNFKLEAQDTNHKDQLQKLINNLSWTNTQEREQEQNKKPQKPQQPNFILSENTITFQKTVNKISIFEFHSVIEHGSVQQAWSILKDNPSLIKPSYKYKYKDKDKDKLSCCVCWWW
ncbi:unnamed protein product [Ambrosiozyma monospora]|uniref:Unnamed protein product n=1 Tax=Ambrosiozyma monospora TaxID=43982 RepID=A0ACB5TAF5_AMBMO|nr:unnamed protein product [Ambrosiozyma monospora]